MQATDNFTTASQIPIKNMQFKVTNDTNIVHRNLLILALDHNLDISGNRSFDIHC